MLNPNYEFHVLETRRYNLDPYLLIVFNNPAFRMLGMTLETLGSRRRDMITIMVDLLDIMQEPRRLTHILYKSNMSYVQLVKYLDNLIELGFTKKILEPHQTYCITTNGKLFMNLIRGKSFKDSS